MPKIKSNSGAGKRFRKTKSGLFKRNKAFHRHLKTVKSAKRRRSLRQGDLVHETEQKRLEHLLPYA